LLERFLAGANCGGCGYVGCHDAAVAVVTGKAPPTVCMAAGPDAAAEIAAVMGVEVGMVEPRCAFNECNGGNRADDKFCFSQNLWMKFSNLRQRYKLT